MLSNVRQITARTARKALAKLARIKLREYPELQDVLRQAHGSQSAAVDVSDSVALFEAVRKQNPACVLELGPGTSSAVIAAALSKCAQFVAIEQSAEWAEQHRKQFPGLFGNKVELIRRGVIVKADHGKPATCFKDIPKRAYDFIHIDGPSHLDFGCDVTCDILNLASSLADRCTIIFDGRQASARFAAPLLELLGFKMHWNRYSLNRHFVRI